PDWSCRVWSGHGWTKEWRAWLLHNKSLCIPPVPFRNMQNFMHKIFAPEKYGESHPEYYPFIDGERWVPGPGERAWRPCESNPDVVRITVEAAREYLDAHPEHNSFSLAMDDIYRLCGCANCCAMDAYPDDYKRKQFSDRHYKFVNAVARELAKTHPDKYIGTLCYHIARELPETVPELEPNVFISMTQRCGEWFRPERKARDIELTKAWRERCQHMSRYDYMGLGFITPRVFPHAMAEGMKLDHELGFESVYNECYVFLPNTAPMMWMVAKLQWNTDLDADDLLNEFYDRMFGDAAKAMRKYYESLEESWMTERPGRSGWGHRRLSTQACAMSVKDVERSERLAAKAKRKTDDPDVLKRIDIVAAGLQYGAYPIRARALTDELAKKSLKSKRAAMGTLAGLAELDELSRERTVFWAEALEREDILGDTVRGLKAKKYFVAANVDEVDARGPVLAALDALNDYAPDTALEKARDLADGGEGALADLAGAWLSVKEGVAVNLVTNPGFEDSATNTAQPEDDWETEDAPTGWSTWHTASDDTRFYLAGAKGVDDSTAAGMQAADSACYFRASRSSPAN
ncbi:MAG: DUF4838 domain-containing protein, partial [bacterium]|nr:DUF4838 domain-containing protein [bacterium]